MSCSEFVFSDTLLDLGFCSPQLDASSRLGAPVSCERSLGDEHRKRTLPLQLGRTLFMAFFLHHGSLVTLNGAYTFSFFVETSIRP